MIPTITTDAKGYPVSPRQNNSQSIEKPRSQTKHRTKRYSTESEYEDTFVLDNVTPLDQFLSNFAKLKRKKKKIYRTRMEDIDSITRLAHEEGIENIDFYESVIIKAKKRRNT
jgi:predicted nucleic acid-binding protein